MLTSGLPNLSSNEIYLHIYEQTFKPLTQICLFIICHVHFVDLRSDERHGSRCISYERGAKLAKEHGLMYCETSALTMEGVQNCFDNAVSYFR